jgi:hypothetical protein
MLHIVQNLGSLEEAQKFNKKVYDHRMEAINKNYHPGCIGSLACISCYHVISDSICLCAGVFVCPKCGVSNGTALEFIPTIFTPENDFSI